MDFITLCWAAGITMGKEFRSTRSMSCMQCVHGKMAVVTLESMEIKLGTMTNCLQMLGKCMASNRNLNTPSGRIGKAAFCGCTFDSHWGCTDLCFARGSQGILPMRVRGATSQLDLRSLTPLSVAGCGWLQLEVPQWAASVHYCK